MENNQPNQTDPSKVEAPVAAPEQELTLDDLIKERVAEAIQAQKPAPQEAPKEATNQGGSGSEVTSKKDSSATDPNAEVLKFVEGFSGRKFESLDEAAKFAKNLNSLVGDNALAKVREDAKVFNSLAEKFATSEGKPLEEAKKLLVETLVSKATAEPAKPTKTEPPVVEDKRVDKTASEVEELKARLNRADLLKKYPYAELVQDEISVIAKAKGISDVEAFESSPLKTLAEAKAKEESRKSPVVTSSNRIGYDKQRVQDLGAKVLKSGSEEDKIALVKEYLGRK